MVDLSPLAPSAAAPRVLIVEDDDSIALALEYLLRREGADPYRIAGTTGALGVLQRDPPALVLLDVVLPDGSGLDLCQALRADPALSSLRILMMTARGSARERERALSLGADGFVTKPFELTTLRQELRRLLA